jgi:hypothetical protein
MKNVLNVIFSVFLFLVMIFGLIIINRYLQAKKSIFSDKNKVEYHIETVRISNITRSFPKIKEICYFETLKDLDNWFYDGVDTELSTEHVSQGKHSLKVKWTKGHSYKLYYFHFPTDWQNYKAFIFDVFNSQNEPSSVNIAVYDNFDAGSFDRPKARSFLMRYELNPGWNTLKSEISVFDGEINTASEKKLIHLYFSRNTGIYYIDNMRLER